MAEPRPMVVLGTSRAGGAAVSGALARMGFHYGRETELQGWGRKCLTAFQLHEASPRELQQTWRSYPQAALMRSELESLLGLLRSPWLIYQPMFGRLLPICKDAFFYLGLNPRYVLCIGAPSGTPHHVGLRVNYVISVLEEIGLNECCVVSRQRLSADPLAELTRIAGDKPSREAMEFAQQELLRWPPPETGGESLAGLPSLIREAVSAVGALGRDEEDAAGRVQSVLDEFRLWKSMLAPPGHPGTQVGFAWMERGIVQTSQAPFLPSGDWQTVRLKVPAPPHTLISGLLYARPCRIWLRRCRWHSRGGMQDVRPAAGPGSSVSEAPGVTRVDGVYESQQLSLRTPTLPGPYELELEMLLEAGPQINVDAAARLAVRLQQCTARRESIQATKESG